MTKILFFIILLLIVMFFVFSNFRSNKEIKNIEPKSIEPTNKETKTIITDGIIFVAVPSKSNTYYEPFFKDIISFHKQFQDKKIANDRLIPLAYQETAYDDIWVRDVAPVATTKLVKFVYAPKNLTKNISQDLNNSFINWLTDNKFEVVYSPLVLDGGNLIWNKKNTVILTTRILEDNPKLNKEEIVAQLKADLSIKTVILIPPEEGDVLAHADGMVKFIDENTMFISDFLGDEIFRQKIEKIILTQMPNAKFVVMASAYTEKGQYDNEIASAKGLYINILETDKAFYVPQFNLPEDKKMLEFIKGYTNKNVIALNIEELSTMGGALNCLTWYCPSTFLPNKY